MRRKDRRIRQLQAEKVILNRATRIVKLQGSIDRTYKKIETASEEEKVPLNATLARLMLQLEKMGGEYEGTLIHHKHLGQEGEKNRKEAEAAVKRNTALHAATNR